MKKMNLNVIYGEAGVVPALLRIVLAFFSTWYGLVVVLKRMAYGSGILRKSKLSCRVISIGNITTGGTGKTPAVIMVAGMIRHLGKKVAVLSRGYRGNRETAQVSVVSDYEKVLLSPEESGDEPWMLAQSLKEVPVLVSTDRLKSGNYAVEHFDTEVAILDDGFQYQRLERDIDIVLIDCLSPFSNMRLLPRGLLREPLSSLKRADMFLLTRVDQASDEKRKFIHNTLKTHAGDKPIIESVHEPSALYRLTDNAKEELSYLQGRDVTILSAIGNPKSFEETLKKLGANIVRRFIYPDHHDFSDDDMNRVSAEKGIIITTEKDGVRLAGRGRDNVWVLKVMLRIITEGGAWEERIKSCLQ